ncbi:hypothetical protein [Fluviicola taffensis]|uniref:Uncharacterized protein n=1 Tax=Fluviicola taffensis (strain DSM 16823 / NCIMB 13979 / RW262) TaxID=755732 RepID=F2IGG4_FLUTR|nr:hypothetical protein [Fluviicola taffensis]AEA42570.1 hypothetical protein Fluta_0565 [Fluviicola taffensis DSM 16823]
MKNSNLKGPKFKDNLKSYFSRVASETPPFFKKLRLIGLVLAAAGTVLIAAPVSLPAGVIAFGGYMLVAGTVATAMSQAAIVEDSEEK